MKSKIKEALNKLKEQREKMVIEIHEMGKGHSATVTTHGTEEERLDEYLRWYNRDDTRIVEHDKRFNKVRVWMTSPRLAQYTTR